MRFVSRTTVAAPASLTDATGPGAKELAKARAYYASIPAATKCYDFKAFKGDDVKQALHSLFYGKCAYCESRISATQPIDIDHYRPKGGVQEYTTHPGYWWLAASWTNLLASCIDCNRRRGQTTARVGMTLAELEAELAASSNKQSSGKHDAFPTLNSAWATAEQDPDPIERPSLIDPTRTDPSNHLVWAGGEVPVILPSIDEHNVECPRGTASILIYALNRLGLVQSRAEVVQTIDAQLMTIKCLAEFAIAATGAARDKAMAHVMQAIMRLRKSAQPDRAYSAMAEVYINAFEDELQSFLEGPSPLALQQENVLDNPNVTTVHSDFARRSPSAQ